MAHAVSLHLLRHRPPSRIAVAMAAMLVVLAGCASDDPEAGPVTSLGAPVASARSNPAAPPGAVPGFKVGKPYNVNGIWYQPGFDWSYEEVGIASWYGPQFHGLETANGERFDMNTLSAAHRTLPLPSIIQVTNLENGRSIKIRVNDRGPFANDRILDVSRHGADLLGFRNQGTARVRVKLITNESMRLAGLEPVNAKSAPPPPSLVAAPAAAPEVHVQATRSLAASASPATGTPAGTEAGYSVYAARSFVQAGAFADRANASRAGAELAHLAPVMIVYNDFDGRSLFRVRLGPLELAETDRILAEAIRAGYSGSRVVME